MSLPSLRPPTLMIDLLFGALMLFAFQMGSPTNQTIIPHDFDLPTADKAADKKAKLLLPLKPISVGGESGSTKLPTAAGFPPTMSPSESMQKEKRRCC